MSDAYSGSGGGNSGVSQLVTVNQGGVTALNAILTALNNLGAKFPNWVTAPATATSTGTAGQVAYDATHFYICVATNTWVRCTLATF